MPDETAPGTILLAPGLVSLDWLTVNMLAPERIGFASLPWQSVRPVRWDYDIGDPDKWAPYLVEPTELRVNPFRIVAYLTDLLGEKVATILSDPYNPKMHDPRWIQVQFANRTLYSGEWVRLYRMLRAIGCEYRSLSRVDIACDGIEGDGGEWPAVMELAQHGRAEYFGKADSLIRQSRGVAIGGEFGSRASNKFIRAYRKKREMKRKGAVKQHIVDAWIQAFGFDPMPAPVEVNRFEVQLKGKEIRRYFDQEGNADWVEGLADVGQRVDIFASMAPGMFDYRTAGADRARDAVPVCRWDWSRVNCAPVVNPRAARTLALSDHTVKTGIKAMWRVAAITGAREGFAAAEQMAAAHGQAMRDWYRSKMGHWLKELRAIEDANDAATIALLNRMRQPE